MNTSTSGGVRPCPCIHARFASTSADRFWLRERKNSVTPWPITVRLSVSTKMMPTSQSAVQSSGGRVSNQTPQLVAAHQGEGNGGQGRARPVILGADPWEHRERRAGNRQAWQRCTNKSRESGTHRRPRTLRTRPAADALAADATLGSNTTLPGRPTAQLDSVIPEIETVTRNRSLGKAADPKAQLSAGPVRPPKRITRPPSLLISLNK